MKERKTILHIVSSLEKKGPVQVIYDLLKNSDFSSYNFILLALKPPKEDSLKIEFEKLPISIIQLDNIPSFNFYKFDRIVSNIVKINNVSICHSHCTRSLIINFFSCRKIFRMHSIQIYPGLQSRTMNGFWAGILINILTKKILKYIEYPVSCSHYVHNELLKKDKIKSFVVVNGSSSKFKFDSHFSKESIKNKLGLDSAFSYLISVGRLSPEKNFLYLIDLFMKSKLSSYKLLIIGDGPLEQELKSIADDSVLIMGFKSNFEEYIYASDYYISASLTEGMPLSVLIAMEAGTPLILSSIPAHEEIFNSARIMDKYIGQLIDVKNCYIDFHGIIDSIKTQLVNGEVQAVYNNNYSPQKMASLYNDLYENIIKKTKNV